ncbi:hypothetical protein TBLA_0C03720 [Henningerozyma blattae CBS 6284]|uniref:Uncharacterized protein n=1 Tax=Henningerozyma blattae (strain ATCC 34711 / CBS 6284 / DSM 70876 / NBRC 10599 / NRRL Y-10934 / UCD 77-7) TaxID=1071380 RepID=I2H1C3_HENB6|nr:hypothetical protein TBLA_0C03720 [Tetrapisispora blattae CBS 6284]CCH60175.1 hypothetical protein TBLA_0C03720 [Tetrapisispora blattae CBS 6284]
MTVIIASLFLPHQPQFIVDSFSDAAANLANSDLVKIKEPIVPTPTAAAIPEEPASRRSVHRSSISQIPNRQDSIISLGNSNRSNSSSSASNNSGTTVVGSSASDNSTDEVISSEAFIENLTTGIPSNNSYSTSGASNETIITDGNDSSMAKEKAVITPRSKTLLDIKDPAQAALQHGSKLSFPSMRRSSQVVNNHDRASLLKPAEVFAHLPWQIVKGSKGNIGMFNAVETALEEELICDQKTNDIIPVSWVGTVGVPTDELPNNVVDDIVKRLRTHYNSNAVITDDITFKGAYKNFCKQILWPTLHYQIPDNPNSKAFEDHSWNHYQKLNQQFANVIIKNYKNGDTIWIHDYHLMLVPGMIREKLPDAKIGFFLHVSFPSSEVFRCFAQRELLLKGICGSNSVGFQTKEYSRHFLQTCNRLLMADIINDGVKYNGKMVRVNSTPIGIDLFKLDKQIKSKQTSDFRKIIRQRWKDKKLIVSRDHLDPIRGIDKKLLAFERFLIENPEYREKVVLIQICIGGNKTTRNDYIERKVTIIADRINSLSSNNISDFSTQHVVFLHQEIDRNQYLALACEADIFLISAFREGMNLTCHDFVTCSMDKKAPLLLSEFTGSADLLKGGAVLINPWDIKHQAESIKYALEMSTPEKIRNWKSMAKAVVNNDSDHWVIKSLQGINEAWEAYKESSTVTSVSIPQIIADYKHSSNRLFILKVSTPPTSRLISALTDLISARNYVYILSHFSKSVFEGLYSRVSNIGLIAENGAYVKLNNGSAGWYNIVEHTYWINQVCKTLDAKIERLPGAYYKIADSMVRFHTENAEDKDRVSSVVGETITHINTLFGSKGVHAYLHKGILFVQQTGLSIDAIQFILRYYSATTSGSNSELSIDQKVEPSIPISPVKQPNSYFNKHNFPDQAIDFALVSGSSSPVVEPLFGVINTEVNNSSLKFGHSIVYGNTLASLANEHVDGANELINVLEMISSDDSKET